MAKQFWKGSTLLAPVPAALVTCGTIEQPNVLTIGWTGIVCTRPPMTYISVRPERHSHDIIKKSGEFVINLTTSAMCRETDFCGVKSGRDTDKVAETGFTPRTIEGAVTYAEAQETMVLRKMFMQQLDRSRFSPEILKWYAVGTKEEHAHILIIAEVLSHTQEK